MASLVMTRGLDTHLARALLESESVEYSLLHEALTRVRAQRHVQPRTLALELLELGLIAAEDVERVLARLIGNEAQTESWQIGALVGGLEIRGHLGTGGMGEVFLAKDTQTGSEVAVKTLPIGGDDELLARFQREAEAQGRVDGHRHVVRIHRSGFAAGRAFLVMDAVSGGDLSQRLKAGPMEAAAAAALVRDLSSGLAHAHERGVLHRDLKPSNILFDELGAPRLADFGLARLVEAKGLTQTGQVLGTPGYMAPEQAEGEAQDERTDVYGLGGVLYAALTCAAPFSGGSVFATLDQVLSTPAPDPRAIAPLTPAPLAEICLRCLEKSPGDRYESARALREALDEFLDGASGGSLVSRRVGLGLLALSACALIGALVWAGLPHEATQAEVRPSASGAQAASLSPAEVRSRVEAETSILGAAELAESFLAQGLEPKEWLEARARASFRDAHMPSVLGVQILPSGELLTWARRRRGRGEWDVQLREAETGTAIRSWRDVNFQAVSPSGNLLALAANKRILIVSLETARVLDDFEIGVVWEAAFLSEEALLVVQQERMTLRRIGGAGSPWGPREAASHPTQILVQGKRVFLAEGREVPCRVICYSLEGTELWRSGTADKEKSIDSRTRALALSRDGQLLAVGSASGMVHVFNAAAEPRGVRERIRALKTPIAPGETPRGISASLDVRGLAHWGGVSSMTWLPDGRLLTVGGKESAINLWSREGACLGKNMAAELKPEGVAIDLDRGWVYVTSRQKDRIYWLLSAPVLRGNR